MNFDEENLIESEISPPLLKLTIYHKPFDTADYLNNYPLI